MCRCPDVKANRQRGFALLFVLWMLALLSLIAASFVFTSHATILAAHHRAEEVRAHALDDAGITRATYALIAPAPRRRWREDGRPYHFAFAGADVVVAVTAESGKLDLNASPIAALAALFRYEGAAPDLSQSLARQIQDQRAARRRAQARPRPPGSLGNPDDPAFVMVDQLGALDGMTPELLNRVRPLVTVYTGLATIDAHDAPADVLLALPGGDPGEIARFLAARDASEVPVPAPASLAGFLGAAPVPPIVTIRAETATAGGGAIARQVTLLLRPGATPPFRILDTR